MKRMQLHYRDANPRFPAMSPTKSLHWLVTAGFTADGSVAYLRADHSFCRRVEQAALFDAKADAEEARRIALRNERVVADPYVIEVARTGAELDLRSARERIRAHGPTVRLRRPDPMDHNPTHAER